MRPFVNLLAGAAVATGSAGLGVMALAQTPSDTNAKVITIHDPAGPKPNPARVGVILPKDIKCSGKVGVQQTCYLYGDPSKPGPYTVMYKWYPGHFSKPHFHNGERWAYVVSGTWWVSSSNVQDISTTYPVHAGTVAIDRKNGIHWDGARTGEKEPAVIILSGIGPVVTTQVDANGKPIAR
jgi:hypothetical protein